MLSSVKSNAKALKAKKSAALNPLKASIKEINSWFKPAEDKLTEVEQTIKKAMLVYHEEKDAQARKEAEAIERRLDKGTMKVETGIAKLSKIEQADKSVQTENGGVQFRQGPAKIRITDVELLIKSHPALLKSERVQEALRMELMAEYKMGAFVPGIGAEVYRDKVVAGVAA